MNSDGRQRAGRGTPADPVYGCGRKWRLLEQTVLTVPLVIAACHSVVRTTAEVIDFGEFKALHHREGSNGMDNFSREKTQ